MACVCTRLPLVLKVRWTLAVYEFLDNDQFSNLDTLMLQLAPGRCLLTLDAGAAEGKPRGDMAKVRTIHDELHRNMVEPCAIDGPPAPRITWGKVSQNGSRKAGGLSPIVDPRRGSVSHNHR